jgi:hypothetical protein
MGRLCDEGFLHVTVGDFDLVRLSLFTDDGPGFAVESWMEPAFLNTRIEREMDGIARFELLDGLLWG